MLPGTVCTAAAAAVFTFTSNVLASSICLIAAIPALLSGCVLLATTRVSLDHRRTVISSGLLSRSSIEICHADLATFDCYQSLLGRLLGYGVVGLTTRGGERYLTPPITDIRAFAAQLSSYRSETL